MWQGGPCEPVQAVCRRRGLSLFIFLNPIFCAAKLLLFFDICKRLAYFFAFLRIFLKIRHPLDRKPPCAQIANKCPFCPFPYLPRARLYALMCSAWLSFLLIFRLCHAAFFAHLPRFYPAPAFFFPFICICHFFVVPLHPQRCK